MLHIFIPSTHRAGQVGAGPLPMIPQHTPGIGPVRYVVPPDQTMQYAQAVSYYKKTGEVLACPEKGIARTRHWIGRWCAEHDVTKFIMMDDDVKFIVRRGPDDWHLKEADQEDVLQMLRTVDDLLDEHGHVGIGTRQGNNNLGVGPAPLLSLNTRTLRCLAYRTMDFLSAEHGRVDVMEDFDVNLQLLERGISNAAVNYWCQDQKMTNAPGGCSTYRTHEVHEASARRLAELHPGVVALRQKVNKSGGAFGTRTEVTIQWKRAYEQGKRAMND